MKITRRLRTRPNLSRWAILRKTVRFSLFSNRLILSLKIGHLPPVCGESALPAIPHTTPVNAIDRKTNIDTHINEPSGMKKACILYLLGLFCACGSSSTEPGDEIVAPVEATPLRLIPGTAVSRGADYTPSDYFTLSEEHGRAGVSVVVGGQESDTISYEYHDGVLSHEDAGGFFFPESGKPFEEIRVIWPDKPTRDVYGDRAPKDQSDKITFIGADYLSARLRNVSRASAIPVTLRHERCKITFTSIWMEIATLEICGYKAYCDPADGSAKLILDENSTDILAPGTVGEITFRGSTEIRLFRLNTQVAIRAGEEYAIEITLF